MKIYNIQITNIIDGVGVAICICRPTNSMARVKNMSQSRLSAVTLYMPQFYHMKVLFAIVAVFLADVYEVTLQLDSFE